MPQGVVPVDPENRSTRARVAALQRHHPHAPETATERAQFKADRLAEHIRRVVDSAPQLSPEQRDRLAALLRDGQPGS